MSDTSISFDHVHVISEDPHAAARWYEEILGGTIKGRTSCGMPRRSTSSWLACRS